jgi:hypothetical protein
MPKLYEALAEAFLAEISASWTVNPREHEFAIRLFDASKSAGQTGVAVIVALASALLARPLRGGMAVVGVKRAVAHHVIRSLLSLAAF